MVPYLIEELRVQLLNTAYCELNKSWNYTNVVSPFTRIYLITEGGGYICPNNQRYELKPGHLYLIPSYVHCSYGCPDDKLSQYYIHFTNQLTDGLKIFDSVPFYHEVKALPLDYQLFDRLVKINKDAALVQSDPKVYQRRNWAASSFYKGNGIAALETNGILRQILSRFIKQTEEININFTQISHLREVFKYIHTHLKQEIRMEHLAEIACYSTDHFTRRFKHITGLLPVEYINNKRIEMAQLLLLTSTKTQKEISEASGFSCQQYYSRVFKKKVGCAPGQYRKVHGFV
ncbi:helix-turn-helix domain-containing protein [Fulvivirga sp. M361]|uniref:helix-turn-helix domain-containing protein n=1 Tax=Fulvivirga sp. M361 TaxID=2594266 RepID=UPI00117B1791|nr:AraC family transcriptional regulator [Fulvivirga sp. M361]TRX57623.1 helix-turn-helix domain-containing protein [Fulvivirga sp. M361]